MNETSLERGFDFSVRLVELEKYLKNEGKDFPLSQRLLACGVGVGVHLRLAAMSAAKERAAKTALALAAAVECGYLLELLSKTGYLTERQSIPLREDCERLIAALSNG